MTITKAKLDKWRKLVEAATPPTNTVSDAIEQRAIWQLGRAAREVIPALIDALAEAGAEATMGYSAALSAIAERDSAIAAKEKAEAFGVRAERATLILADEFEMDGDTILRLKAERDAATARADALAKEYDMKDAPASGWHHAVEGACNAVAEHRMNDAFVILCALRDNISAYIAKG